MSSTSSAASTRLGVAHDGDVHGHVLGDLGRVDVDVDEGGVGSEGLQLAGDPVVEAHAHRDDQVGLADRVVGVRRAVHAQHAHGQVVVLGEAALAGERGGDRDMAVDGQLAQLVGGAGDDHPAPGVDDRALGRGDDPRRFP